MDISICLRKSSPGVVALDAEMHGTNATTGEGCDDLEREILGINQASGSVVATVIVLNERRVYICTRVSKPYI